MLIDAIRELNSALSQLVEGRPYRKIVPRQFQGRITLPGTATTLRLDGRYFTNDGTFPFVLTAIDVKRGDAKHTNFSLDLPTVTDDVILVRVRDRQSGVAIVGNSIGVQTTRFRSGTTVGAANDLGNLNTPACIVPGGGYEVPPNGGFDVEVQTYDVVNNDGGGSSDTVDVLLIGFNIVER